jgi:pimeloyl-ACP methyl ester carboxylesterase
MSKSPRRAFVTSDGVQLSYIRQGTGRPIVLIHGWSQCAEEFKHQIEPLSARYDVIALDQRSHGESQKVSYGLSSSLLWSFGDGQLSPSILLNFEISST